MGYRLSGVRDLTNSNYDNLGAAPSSSGNHYQRNIGAGFFTEWGSMHYYTDAGFVFNGYWTSNTTDIAILVESHYGFSYIGDSPDGFAYVLCTAP
ncbi:hypothetical protein [Gilliamella sp. GillExp13]|uniref:hypothetical protein n=1 Tax=Gilliamella sp. GillExp13 TaxID=3120243 RepID=UPI0011468808|nr:hypothetical protein [Gilliamella apicola]